jgi:hypothetical protein
MFGKKKEEPKPDIEPLLREAQERANLVPKLGEVVQLLCEAIRKNG